MKKYDKDIIKTLNILILVNNESKLLKKDDVFLEIKKEYLDNENISIADFIESLKELSKNFYILHHLTFFDKDKIKEIKKELKSIEKDKLEKYYENLFNAINNDKDKIIKDLEEKLELSNLELELDKKKFIKKLKETIKQIKEKVVSYVIVNNCKDIEKLNKFLKKEKGTYKELHKLNLDFSPITNRLILNELKIKTKDGLASQKVLSYIFSHNITKEYEISEIGLNFTNKKIYDSCKSFNNKKCFKEKKIEFFIISMDYVRINPDILPKNIFDKKCS